MKKTAAAIFALMILIFSLSALALGHKLTAEEAKQKALAYASLEEKDVQCSRAYLDWEDGRRVFEVEFYVNGIEYDVDVDAETGVISHMTKDCNGRTELFIDGISRGTFSDWDGDWEDAFDFEDLYDWD